MRIRIKNIRFNTESPHGKGFAPSRLPSTKIGILIKCKEHNKNTSAEIK
ncbi:MAG: hypothetical protein KA146_03095 [Leptospiraceae bacterium]|nr:hypothetical protein [Leptospiraceae bacterium]